MSLSFRLIRPPEPARLGEIWERLAAGSGASFFQSWQWTGTCFEARFPDPWLLLGEQNGAVRSLALFNRTRRHGRTRLLLGESGDPAWDRLFIEYNGVLGDPSLAAPALRAARRIGLGSARPPLFGRALTLSGLDGQGLVAARAAGPVRLRQSRAAPAIDLAALRQAAPQAGLHEAHLAALSANSRAQIRRSAARYAMAGELRIDAAANLAEAEDFLARLIALHEATWQRRGQPGAFAEPRIRHFHRALIAAGLARGAVELLRIAAGAQVIGYLYNFRHDGAVLAYQSGFDYDPAQPQRKPGLTCHALAIRQALGRGDRVYDLLAGAERYKTSLVPRAADATTMLHWLEAGTLRAWLASGS